jgi:transcriptional regulator with XRE-family HTH domain
MSDATRTRATSNAGIPRRRGRTKGATVAFPQLDGFGKRLESVRLQSGLTQDAVAKRAGISTNHYRDIAHANANPTVVVFLRLVEVLGVSIGELFDSPQPSATRHRMVLQKDLEDLVTVNEQFGAVVKRLTGNRKDG